MKQYQRQVEKIAKTVPTAKTLAKIGSRTGSIDDLIGLYRGFFKDAYDKEFNRVVKYVWISNQYTYDGVAIGNVQEAGFGLNKIYGYFIKYIVGSSQKPLTDGLFFSSISSYITDFFPKFYEHNPFDETKYFEFPYQNISIMHLAFVYQCEDRLEMLEYADGKSMSYGDFRDWALNHVLSKDPKKYVLSFWHNAEYLKKKKTKGRYKNK